MASYYETPVLKILVGEQRAPFNVNEGLLQSTSFFAKHGSPARKSKTVVKPKREITPHREITPKREVSEESQADRQQSAGLFRSGEREHTATAEESMTIDLTMDDDADYVLKGFHFYTREAFAIFVRSLNDAPLVKPKDQQDCRALFQAYALAQQYDTESLQNQVIDTLQSYYVANAIPITDVMYIVEHWGEEIDCFLAAYLVAQAGFEMSQDWTNYRKDNCEIVDLFASGKNAILEQLFSAAVQSRKDPAKEKRAWRFSST